MSCDDLVDINQCGGISGSVINGGCYWLYEDSDKTVNRGKCNSKTDNSVACSAVKRKEQCQNNSQSTFGNRCTWVYSSSSGDDGNCYSKDDATHTCDEIKNNNQCESGGGLINLDGKCDIYGTTCKTNCSELGTGTTCTSGDRENDCFLLENADGSKRCKDTVCLFIFIY
jgi:hypothetical protein